MKPITMADKDVRLTREVNADKNKNGKIASFKLPKDYFINWQYTGCIRDRCILSKKQGKSVLDLSEYRIKTKTKRDKEVYLLHELLKDIKHLSKEHEREFPVIENTSSLKRYLVQEYSNEIAVFPSGKYLLVHPIDINSCTYCSNTS